MVGVILEIGKWVSQSGGWGGNVWVLPVNGKLLGSLCLLSSVLGHCGEWKGLEKFR